MQTIRLEGGCYSHINTALRVYNSSPLWKMSKFNTNNKNEAKSKGRPIGSIQGHTGSIKKLKRLSEHWENKILRASLNLSFELQIFLELFQIWSAISALVLGYDLVIRITTELFLGVTREETEIKACIQLFFFALKIRKDFIGTWGKNYKSIF